MKKPRWLLRGLGFLPGVSSSRWRHGAGACARCNGGVYLPDMRGPEPPYMESASKLG